ncbi:MAG: hypothetical protein OXH15_10090 [Gammaproteobacteria bacterium]|nr:hypothetical protein [Gammaproteobacteria bacterium]
MTGSDDHDAPSLVLLDRWIDLRAALDSRYGVDAYPFAADRIVNDARRRGASDTPPSLAFFHFWTAESVEAAIACCEHHVRVHPRELPRPPPRERRHFNRRIDAEVARACLHDARTLGLTPEHLVGIAVHDLLAAAALQAVPLGCIDDAVGYVLDTVAHLIAEIEHHGNVPDPRTLPIRDPAADGEIPDPPPPWSYVPDRPPPASDAAVPHFRRHPNPNPAFGYLDPDDPAWERTDDWIALVEDLSFRYGWFGYPDIETRILLYAFAEGAEGLPDSRSVNHWTAEQMAAATAACERYVRDRPRAPLPFPPRDLRPYDADATATEIAAFARACEALRLVPEDVLLLALHTLCAADAPNMPRALRTLGLVVADIEIHGNVRDPVAAPAVVH